MAADGLLARLYRHAAERPASPAYRQADGASLNYEQLAQRASAVAGLLRERLPPRAIVILSCANQIEYPAAFLGILAAGCTVFPVSSEAADAELMRAASQSGALGAIGDARAVRLLAPAASLTLSRNDVSSLPTPTATIQPPAETPGDLLLQSSGTTALPKIARRTGLSLDAVSAAMAEAIRFSPADRVLMTVPLTHSYGLEHGLLAPIWAGSSVHLCRGLDLSTMRPALADGGITVLPSVPAAFEMLRGPMGDGMTMPALRVAYAAGSPLPGSVFDGFKQKFGVPVTQLYGATEIGSVAFNAAWEAGFDPASVGRGMRDVSIRILDLEEGASSLPPGREGQVAIRAASMFSGYLDAPAPLVDGHFPTGDLGNLDASGRLFITGRIKLLIDIGGMKVNPLEVEAVLQRHAGVAACVVVPVRQSETVFRLKAVVTPLDPAHPPATAELRDLARQHLAAYKVPRVFEFRRSLPCSPTGKVLRHLVEAS